MSCKEKIRRLLVSELLYTEGEANAARIYKGHGFSGYGWTYQPFGQNATYRGATCEEACASIQAAGAYKRELA